MLLLRKKIPKGVINKRGDSNKCDAKTGDPTRIVRNLGILKITLLHPIRSDQYKIGPREEIFTQKAIMIIGNKKNNIATKDNTISQNRFM